MANGVSRRAGQLAGVVSLGAAMAVAGPTAVAFAAGSGYGAGTTSTPGQTGAYTNVASVQTVAASGGTVSATVGDSTVTVTVPAGDLTAGAQIVFLSASASGSAGSASGVTGTPLYAFGVQVDQNGQKLDTTFTYPITVTVTNPAITAGSTVYELSGGSFVPASGWTTSAGKATGSFSVDVDYLVAAGTASTTSEATVSGATTATTGKPFLGEEILAAGLLGVGLLGVRRWRRASRSAR